MSQNKKLQTTLLQWFLFLSIIPIILVSYFGLEHNSKTLHSLSLKKLEETADLNTRFIKNWFDFRKADISTWSGLPQNVAFLEELSLEFQKSNQVLEEFTRSYKYETILDTYQESLLPLVNRYNYIYDIFLIDTKGNILYTIARENDFATNLLYGKYKDTLFASSVRKTLLSGKFTFSDLQKYEPSANGVYGFLNAPVVNAKGEMIGVLSVQIIYNKEFFHPKDDGEFLSYLIGEDCILRSSIYENKTFLLEKQLSKEQCSNILGAQGNLLKNHINKYTNVLEQKVIGVSNSIKVFDTTWVLVNEVDEDVLFASRDVLVKQIVLGLILFVVFIVLIAHLVSKRITKPIEMLTQANKDFSSGKRDIQVELHKENKEMAQLTYSFNEMMRILSENETRLKEQTKIAQIAVATRSEFLANMSHEIRTPMNGVIGMLRLLNSTQLSPTQQRQVDVAQNSAVSLLGLINDILDFSKIEAGKLDIEHIEFDIYNELRDFIDITEHRASQKGLKLLLDMSELEKNIIIADPSRIRQILNNLVVNAIKFTQEGEVKLKAKLHKIDPKNATLCFEIHDTGIGIPQEKIATLFESFSQVDNSTTRKYGGTGLGLSIAKQLALLMGGDISVQSEVSKGSIFHVTLRVGIKEDGILLKREELQESIFYDNKVKLLIVEDNKTNQIVVEGILEEYGIQVDIANHGEEALAYLKKADLYTYGFIFMDCQMPIMDGYETTRNIRAGSAGEIHKNIAIIAMTANAMQGDREKCIEAGMDDFMTKPIDIVFLEKILKKWIVK